MLWFGKLSIFQGTLPNGTEVVVKRISRTSGQGAEEAVLVAKLKHIPG